MPSLGMPVLNVDANVIHKVDTSNPENLFSMWTLFSKCPGSVTHGRRLENLTWRLWQRETFCVELDGATVSSAAAAASAPPATTPNTSPRNIQQSGRVSTAELPQLSGSVDSIVEEEDEMELSSESAPVDINRPRIRRQDSYATSCRSRGRERHLTPDGVQEMFVYIIDKKEPLTAPLPEIPVVSASPSAEKQKLEPATFLERSGSTSTEESTSHSTDSHSFNSTLSHSDAETAESRSKTTIVRGFSPPSSSFTRTIAAIVPGSSSAGPIPEPNASPAAKPVQHKKQPAKFALGGSSSSPDESLSDHPSEEACKQAMKAPLPKRKVFQVGGSSADDNSLKSALHSSRTGSLLSAQKKTTSFNVQPVSHVIPAPAVVDDDDQSETEAEYVDESAIDDDDEDSDWEDSVEDSGRSSMDDKINFNRVDSKVNMSKNRSLITLMLENKDRNLDERNPRSGTLASQSTPALHRAGPSRHPTAGASAAGPSAVAASPNDSDEAPLMMRRSNRAPPLRPINEVPRSAAQPIMTTTNSIHHQLALSPRTTRRNMLSTELTESLRRHLLWERSQKTSTATAVLKRRHTSHDVANLKQFPERAHMKKDADFNPSSWDHYLNREALNGYHSKGW